MNNWYLDKVSKVFDNTVAIDDISLEIKSNKIYGLIGKNGAGKTTMLKLLANQLDPDKGIIKKGSDTLKDNDKLTQSICLARETINIKGIERFPAKKILEFASYIYLNWDNDYCKELIDIFSLDIDKKYSKLSKGMHTVIGIIIGLASRAPLTLFDEPYVGLDPVAREIFYENLIKDYEKNKRTIIISSHLINELENLFERVLVINDGKLLLNEKLEEIKRKAKLISGEKGKVESILQGKKVIHKQSLGRMANYTVLDRFTDAELQKMDSANIKYNSVSLQKLFVNLATGGFVNVTK